MHDTFGEIPEIWSLYKTESLLSSDGLGRHFAGIGRSGGQQQDKLSGNSSRFWNVIKAHINDYVWFEGREWKIKL